MSTSHQPLTREQARDLLDVKAARVAFATLPNGEAIDDDGNKIDKRQLEPWVWALGPFGSWPETLASAEVKMAAHEEWVHGKSFRLGWVVVWASGWGFGAKAAV